jgi:hypothetical protein
MAVLEEKVLVFVGKWSLVAFIATLLIVPLMIIFIPSDYFVRDKSWFADNHPVIRFSYHLLKNALGVVLLLLGVVLLFLPGQGLLTILIAVMLLEFPGKRELERKLIARPKMLDTLNRIRTKVGRAPLQA